MLANAPTHFSSDSNVELILISSVVIIVVAFVGFIPIQLARRRRHRHAETITAVLVLWGLLSAGSTCYYIMEQFNWSASVQQSIVEGYYNPHDTSGQPNPPLGLWCGLAVCYALAAWWATHRPTGR